VRRGGPAGCWGVYTKVGLAAPPKTPSRDDGRDGADGVDDNDDDMLRRLDYGTSELAEGLVTPELLFVLLLPLPFPALMLP